MIAARTTDADAVLSIAGITKRFGEALALDDVSMRLRPGTVHALLGENGAGKTTLMRIAFGLTRPDAGSVAAYPGAREIASAADAIACGIGMVHQHFSNVPAMTVAENIALGGRGRFSAVRAAALVLETATRSGLALDPGARVETLPVGAQQRLEILKALAHGARTLILDEPTGVLAPDEAQALLAWLRNFANEGNAVVLITHKLRDALAIADDVTVLRRGRVVLQTAAFGLSEHDLASALLGEDAPSAKGASVGATPGDVVATLDAVTAVDERGVTTVHDVSLRIRRGEIVGIAAVEGSGQRDLLRLLAGRRAACSGSITLPERVGFIPEDRHRDALALEFTPAENLMLNGAGRHRGVISWKNAESRAAALIEAFDVRGAQADQPVRTMSGGNQQKFVMAREVEQRVQLVVAENPTRGLDVRATRAVQERLAMLAHSGAAVVFHSSDVDEVLSLATRVVVMHAGRIRELANDRAAVGRAMLGSD